jgi:hypothetical protein
MWGVWHDFGGFSRFSAEKREKSETKRGLQQPIDLHLDRQAMLN